MIVVLMIGTYLLIGSLVFLGTGMILETKVKGEEWHKKVQREDNLTKSCIFGVGWIVILPLYWLYLAYEAVCGQLR